MWKPEDWKQCESWTPSGPNHIDDRHCRFICDLMMACDFKDVLEVGPHDGRATSAFLQARKDGKKFRLVVCDIAIRPPLQDLLAEHWAGGNLREVQCNSTDLGDAGINWGQFDLVLIDGDHRLGQVSRELGLCLFHETQTILAHDTGEGGPAGSLYLRQALQLHPAYRYRHDQLPRRGEWTGRGFSLFTRSGKVWEQSEKPWIEMLK